MGIKERLESALKDAMRARAETRRSTLRMALTAVKLAEVQKKDELDEGEVMAILQKEVKSRQEALKEARDAGRGDLVAEGEAEIAVLEEFLPRPLSEAELREKARAAIQESGASSPADMGKVMQALMPQVRGRADGGKVSGIVREMLQD